MMRSGGRAETHCRAAHAIICGAGLVTQSAQQPDQRVRSLPMVVHDQNVQRARRMGSICIERVLPQYGTAVRCAFARRCPAGCPTPARSPCGPAPGTQSGAGAPARQIRSGRARTPRRASTKSARRKTASTVLRASGTTVKTTVGTTNQTIASFARHSAAEEGNRSDERCRRHRGADTEHGISPGADRMQHQQHNCQHHYSSKPRIAHVDIFADRPDEVCASAHTGMALAVPRGHPPCPRRQSSWTRNRKNLCACL